MRPSMHASTQRGNVLFLILIAVALFAALSYAITQSSRSSGDGGLSTEKARLIASEILQHATLVEQTVTRLRTINQCSFTQISFENPVVVGYDNASSPADGRCRVFHPAGGGLSWREPPTGVDQSYDYVFALFRVMYVGTHSFGIDCGGPEYACYELTLLLRGVPDSVCLEINKKVANLSTIPLEDNAPNWPTAPSGYYKGPPYSTSFGDSETAPQRYTACVRSPYFSDAVFYQVVFAR